MVDIITKILQTEGGFSNDPADRGGPTNLGITQATLSWWLKRPATIEDLKTLTPEKVRPIYETIYIENPNFDSPTLPAPLRNQLIDFGVNSGPALAASKLQEIVGVTPDGKLGPVTEDAIQTAVDTIGATHINNRLVASRLKMIGRLISRNPSQARFALGWINRALDFLIVED